MKVLTAVLLILFANIAAAQDSSDLGARQNTNQEDLILNQPLFRSGNQHQELDISTFDDRPIDASSLKSINPESFNPQLLNITEKETLTRQDINKLPIEIQKALIYDFNTFDGWILKDPYRVELPYPSVTI